MASWQSSLVTQRWRGHGTHARRLHSAPRAISQRGRGGFGLHVWLFTLTLRSPALHMYPSDQRRGLCRFNSDNKFHRPVAIFCS